MPHFNIHWKGYPHRRFPRIRVVSSNHSSLYGPNRGHIAATNVYRLPLSQPLKSLRERHRKRVHNRRSSSRESWRAIARRRRQNRRMVKHNVEVFGRDLSQGNQDYGSKGNSFKKNKSSLGPKTLNITTKGESYTNNATSPVVPEPDIKAQKARKSSIHTPKADCLKKGKNTDANNFRHGKVYAKRAVARRRDAEVHIQELKRARNGYINHKHQEITEGNRTYEPRIWPANECRIMPETGPAYTSSNTLLTLTDINASNVLLKHQKDDDTNSEYWISAKGFGTSPDFIEDTYPGFHVAFSDGTSDEQSRTPSEKRALQKFKTELSQYLENPKRLKEEQISPPSSSISAFTVAELIPYRTEFQAAGLAVTSAEQRATHQKQLPPPPTPPKDKAYLANALSSRKNTIEGNINAETSGQHSTWETITYLSAAKPGAINMEPLTDSGEKSTKQTTTLSKQGIGRPVTRTSQPHKKSLPWLRKNKTITAHWTNETSCERTSAPPSDATTIIFFPPTGDFKLSIPTSGKFLTKPYDLS
jgi:hypothetical protein